jgi:hypothetical protein
VRLPTLIQLATGVGLLSGIEPPNASRCASLTSGGKDSKSAITLPCAGTASRGGNSSISPVTWAKISASST